MQRVTNLVILALLVAASRTAGCANNNSQIILLQKENVVLLQTPSFATTSCGEEWRRYGTCCDSKTLGLAVNLDRDQIKALNMSIAQKLVKIEDLLSPTIESMRYVLTNPLSPPYDSRALLVAPENDPFTGLQARSALNISAVFSKCWSHMTTVRSASVCTACSGRSQVFFKQKNLLLTDTACTGVIDSCFSNFILLARTSEITRRFISMLDLIEKSGSYIPSSLIQLKLDLEQLVSLYCNPASPLATCTNLLDTPNNSTVKQWMCSKFLRFREKSLLAEINPLLDGLILAFEIVGRYFKIPTTSSKNMDFDSNFAVDSYEDSEPLVEPLNITIVDNSVLVVSSTDPLWTSTASSEIPPQPANLTLAFP